MNQIMKIGVMVAIIPFFLMAPGVAFSASGGFFLTTLAEKGDDRHFSISLEANHQENVFPIQRNRGPEEDASGYVRHFEENRDSTNTYSSLGMKASLFLSSFPGLYVTAGYSDADIKFNYSDDLTPNKAYYSTTVEFSPESFLVLGGGVMARLLKKRLFHEIDLTLGADLGYRFFDTDAEKQEHSEASGDYTIHYSLEMHEIQLAIGAALGTFETRPISAVSLGFIPFAGAKISHFIGDESYQDPGNTYLSAAGHIHDPIFYEGDLDASNQISFFVGTGIKATEALKIDIETRFGDEEGYGIHVSYMF